MSSKNTITLQRNDALCVLASAARGELPRCACGDLATQRMIALPKSLYCDECFEEDVGDVGSYPGEFEQLPHAPTLRAAMEFAR